MRRCPMADPIPAVYDVEEVDEMTLACLTVLAEARTALAARFDGETRRVICDVLDEQAAEIVANHSDDD